MKKNQVKRCLDSISEMSDAEIEMNKDFIRKVATEAFALTGSLNKAITKKRK